MSSGPAPAQWSRADVLTTAAVLLVGTMVWSIGWFGVSGRPSMEEQRAPLNLAVIGVALIGFAHVRWFLRGRRAVGLRRRALMAVIAPHALKPTEVLVNDLVAGGERFFHRPDCGMADDRGWIPTARAAQEQDGRVPCGVCAP